MSTSVSPPQAGSRSPRKRGTALRRWVIGISAVLLSLGLFLVIRTQGYVWGKEFSPTHFQVREFSFYEIPLLHLQITPIRRAGATPVVATYVRQNSMVKIYPGTPNVWHLVEISRGLTGSTPADADLLMEQLETETGGKSYWRTWSVDHPKQAKVLWPKLQTLAERELYVLMPSLFELAQRDLQASELDAEIESLLRREYRSLVIDMRAANRGDLADQLLDEAIRDFPDDAKLAQLRLSSPAAPDSPASDTESPPDPKL